MIPGLIIALLAVLALVYVTGPVRKPDAIEEDAAPPEAETTKIAALTAILDLESERDVGKLSETDLVELRTTYEREALAALAELDAAQDLGVEDPLEREIAAMRERLSAERCPRCGAHRQVGTTCTRCGA